MSRRRKPSADFGEKQKFLNTIYERFFQGFCVKVADTHGIVYTPLPLVNFMIASVEQALSELFRQFAFGRQCSHPRPFHRHGQLHRPPDATHQAAARCRTNTGTSFGCNEIMLLPYYVASMNIEHAYWEATKNYEAFEGICLVDTFQTINGKMSYFANGEKHEQEEMTISFNPENTKRISRQKSAPIRVVIANPPYNAGQVNENDNNKNRKYPELDRRVSATYGADSKATLLRKLADPYVKAIRYATDRIGDVGIICYVNNNSFIADYSFERDAQTSRQGFRFDLRP